MTLSVNDFVSFFEEVYSQHPFPWQKRLLSVIADSGKWPDVLDLPTGSGKTAAIDIAVFHLALEAERGDSRRAPVRIAFVVDRRLVVDDAFERARKLETALNMPKGPVTARIAERLKILAGHDEPALVARRLRGGIPREDDWTRTPSQPTILCSTVDQVGSRLLFRGYGVSDSMKPVHAGLIGSDCLILLDEAHLAEPFRQTLEWTGVYREQNWRESSFASPWSVALLTATPGQEYPDAFSLDDTDRSNPILAKRLSASKLARLVFIEKPKASSQMAVGGMDEGVDPAKDIARRVDAIIRESQFSLKHFESQQTPILCPAVGIVVNRVARARAVFERLIKTIPEDKADLILLIGPARPLDRDDIAKRLAPIRTAAERDLKKTLIIVATQCIEAGVDIDLDALITEAAPLDCLRQRFGRLNRAGRDIVPYASIIAAKADVAARTDDPIYGDSIRNSWDCLTKLAVSVGGVKTVEFGLDGFAVDIEPDALSPTDDAPILLPGHLDLFAQTSPVPAADPEVSLYLHGTSRQPDSISVIWRADIDPDEHTSEEIRRLLTLVPPRSAEAIELPLWAVKGWLKGNEQIFDQLADVASASPVDEREHHNSGERQIFCWKGDSEESEWVLANKLHPGDTVIAPASHGGVDDFGWNPAYDDPVLDIARKAHEPFAGRRFAIRAAPGLLRDSANNEVLAEALAGAVSSRWQDLRAVLLDLDISDTLSSDLKALDHANRKRSITAYLDLYGVDDKHRPRGVVFVAPFGISGYKQEEEGRPNSTEDDTSGSIFGVPLSLQQHSRDVERKAEDFARTAGLPADRIADLKLAGFLHDAGKRDPRFQAWLHYDDPLGPDPDDETTILAKSGRPLPRAARAQSGLPAHWRHEALSVRLARAYDILERTPDPDLVLWLVGTHHGYGRPLFPHQDPTEMAPNIGPQSLAFDWHGLDWPSLFERLKVRYGWWELARMEAILRLADHRASEVFADQASGGGK